MERKISDEECPVRKSMQIFAGKWTLLIIFQINHRIIRYGELKRAIPGISEKMLIDELKFLCDSLMHVVQIFRELQMVFLPRLQWFLLVYPINKLLPMLPKHY